MDYIRKPNLPLNPVKLAVCGDYPDVVNALRKCGADVIVPSSDSALPSPVMRHADMICCHAAQNTLVTCDDELAEKLAAFGIIALRSDSKPEDKYPDDCILNCLSTGELAVGRASSLDKKLRQVLEDKGARLLDVRQGYARCSAAVVDERSFITADKGIAASLERAGCDVLLISPGGIELPGYDTGFIGGCCGKLSAHRMLFHGNPMTHPDGTEILSFLHARGVEAQCLHDGLLTDFGGFIPLCE